MAELLLRPFFFTTKIPKTAPYHLENGIKSTLFEDASDIGSAMIFFFGGKRIGGNFAKMSSEP